MYSLTINSSHVISQYAHGMKNLRVKFLRHYSKLGVLFPMYRSQISPQNSESVCNPSCMWAYPLTRSKKITFWGHKNGASLQIEKFRF